MRPFNLTEIKAAAHMLHTYVACMHACMHAVHYITLHYITLHYSTVQYSTIQYNTIQYNTIQYNTIHTYQQYTSV